MMQEFFSYDKIYNYRIMNEQLERPRWPFAGEMVFLKKRHSRIEGFPDVRVRRGDIIGTSISERPIMGTYKTIEINTSSPETLGQSIDQLTLYRDLFDGLRRDGMRVANFNYVIVESSGGVRKAELLTVIDEINGPNLSEMKRFDQHALSEIDQSFTGYLKHLQRVLREGGSYWWDIGPDQIVYGTRQGESEPHAYVVDVDPIIKHWTKLQRGNSVKDEVELEEINRMGFNILKVGDYFNEIERKMSFNHQLTLTRDNLGETIDIFKSSKNNIPHLLFARVEDLGMRLAKGVCDLSRKG